MMPIGPAALTPALVCPRCGAPGPSSPSPQRCASCGKPFVALAGPALDGRVVPPLAAPEAGTFFLKWSVVFTYKSARIDPGGVRCGLLDPIVGIAPVDEVAIGWPDVVSIAVWRTTAWGLAIATPLCFLPFAFLAALLAVASHVVGAKVVAGLVALAFTVVPVLAVRHAVRVGHLHARIVGRRGVAQLKLDRRLVVYQELFRRAGLLPPPQP